jgi:hypothetical protein
VRSSYTSRPKSPLSLAGFVGYTDSLFPRPCEGVDCDDEDLESIASLYTFVVRCGDYGCANACLDAMRELLLEEHEDFDDPLSALLPVLKTCCDNASDMLADTLAYGPCADSGKLEK